MIKILSTTIKYIINNKHEFFISVIAKIEPVKLTLSR